MSIVVMWQHNVYYVFATFSVERYLSPAYLITLNVTHK